jgi:ribosomal protein L11 methyltransferase
MQATTGGLWAARLDLPGSTPPLLMAAIENVLEPLALSVSRFERRGGAQWRIEAIFDAEPDGVALAVPLRTMLERDPKLVVRRVPQRDWLAEIARQMPGVRAGRFFVRGSHVEGPSPRGAVTLTVDPGLAFGTGHHETTSGCLRALDRLARRGRQIRNVLDLGCGTGVLAMAAAHLWPGASILAADNDPAAVTVAREVVTVNGLDKRIRTARSEGYRAAAVRNGAPYDLVIANILAGPLIALADGLACHTKPGSVALLAGLLHPQEDAILGAHAQVGFRLIDRRLEGDWPILVLEKSAVRSRATKRTHAAPKKGNGGSRGRAAVRGRRR